MTFKEWMLGTAKGACAYSCIIGMVTLGIVFVVGNPLLGAILGFLASKYAMAIGEKIDEEK